jgi:hypothetical protein
MVHPLTRTNGRLKGTRVQQTSTSTTPHLGRSLGLWAIVGLGLGYMTPTTVFDTFGIVSGETDGVVPLAYLVALVAMVFTAVSYGRMTRVYPSAGSAYTYSPCLSSATSETNGSGAPVALLARTAVSSSRAAPGRSPMAHVR